MSNNKNNNGTDPFLMGVQAALINGKCYIATMVYGSYDAKEVTILRRYRDEVLLNNWFGKVFVGFYYAVSPYIVELLKNRKKMNRFIKKGLDKIVRYIELNKFKG